MNYEEEKRQAIKEFSAMLDEQIERAEKISKDSTGADFFSADKIIIGICLGDGIGPVITQSAERVLNYLLKDDIKSGKVQLRHIEGLTIENRLAKGKSIPDDVMAEIKKCHVLLKGPTTTPKGGTGEADIESANVILRKELDLYANIRPIQVPEKGIDWTFFRENTEGEYVLGSHGVDIGDILSFDFKVTTTAGTERISRAAFDFAKANGKTNVALVTKANIMKKTDGRFSRVVHKIAEEYPGITLEEWYVDIMTANLVNKALRTKFQVILLPNLYGDIITDEAAQIQGGVGTGGSANIGDIYAMFEPIHGSAPRMIQAGLGDYANPVSMLKAAQLMLRHIKRTNLADRLEKAITICNAQIKVTGDKDGATTKDFTDCLIKSLAQN